MTNCFRLRCARAITCEVLIDATLCIAFYSVATAIEEALWRGVQPALSRAGDTLAVTVLFALTTLAVRAVTHTPWHFLLRYRAARARGFTWRRTLGILAGTYALAYLVGIAATGGVLWESLVEQPWRVVLPSFAAALAAPLVTHRLLGEVLDSLAADGRPAAKPPRRQAAKPR